MLSGLPTEYYVIVAACIAIMGFCAFYLGSPDWRVKAGARAGLTISAASLFVFTMTYLSVFIAILIVVLPFALIIAFFTDLFSGLF